MDELLQKYNDYMKLKNCKVEYLLCNGNVIEFTFFLKKMQIKDIIIWELHLMHQQANDI